MKTQLEIGDEIVRFEVGRRIDTTYTIDKVTKTLAKATYNTFERDLKYSYAKPEELSEESKEMLIAGVILKGEKGWSTKRFYLIKKGSNPK
jgi:hypothetical protein